jgi:hypothetical protein
MEPAGALQLCSDASFRFAAAKGPPGRLYPGSPYVGTTKVSSCPSPPDKARNNPLPVADQRRPALLPAPIKSFAFWPAYDANQSAATGLRRR